MKKRRSSLTAGFLIMALCCIPPGIAESRGVDLESLLDSSPSNIQTSFEDVGPPSQDSLFGMQRFDSPSFEKAAAKAAAQHSPGVWMIQTGSGMGFVATGDGSYPTNLTNRNAAREAHRQAYVAAHMRAKKNLAQALRGLPLEAREKLAEEAYDEDNAEESLNARSSRYEEQIHQAVEATLRGFVTYSVFDDGEGLVYVSIVTSPKIRHATRAVSEGLLDCTSLGAGMKRISRELDAGLVPPVGGRIINVPETNEVALVSFGSALVHQDTSGASTGQDKLTAGRRAKAQADKAMVALMTGDQFMWEYGYYREQESTSTNFEEVATDTNLTGPSQESTKKLLEERKETFLNLIRDSEAAQSVVRGIVPQGTNSKTWYSKDGWCYVANVYTPSSGAQAEAAAKEMGITAYVPENPPGPPPIGTPSKPGSEPLSVPVKETLNTHIDEEEGIVEILGEAVAPEGKEDTGQGKLLARRGAYLDLQRNFLEFIKGAQVDAETLMEDLMVTSDEVNSTVKGYMKRIVIREESWDGSVFTVKGSMSLKEIDKLLKGFVNRGK
ncbi:MAG TPA: hypothetical protein PLW97_09710 [Synergistaceae bacterium]|nr:hypothetical protein [Synergistaceae bacterium]